MRTEELQSRPTARPGARRRWREQGLSLLELLVGLIVGLVCVLIIVQLLTLWEARKRSVAAGNDAQISGTLGAFALDRDMRLAAYGFGTADSATMGCNVTAFSSTVSPTNVSFNLRPVDIKKTDNQPDEIHVLYGNSSYFVASQPLLSSTDETKTLKSREGFRVGDKAIVSSGTGVCQLIEITALSLTDLKALEHVSGATYTTIEGQNKTATMNKPGGTGTTISTGLIFNLGPSPVETIWAVNRSRQTLTRYNALTQNSVDVTDVIADVVTLKAQYGYDTSGDGQIGSAEWYDTLPTGTDWSKVLAVRFGLLVRSRQFERPNVDNGAASPVPVTPTAPRWGNGSIAFVMRNVNDTDDAGNSADALNGAAAANNWRNYRYRVYDQVVPLRNMIWGTAP